MFFIRNFTMLLILSSSEKNFSLKIFMQNFFSIMLISKSVQLIHQRIAKYKILEVLHSRCRSLDVTFKGTVAWFVITSLDFGHILSHFAHET